MYSVHMYFGAFRNVKVTSKVYVQIRIYHTPMIMHGRTQTLSGLGTGIKPFRRTAARVLGLTL